jgi:hypothetical protein
MPRFLLHHRHEARECGPVFASFKGFSTPLRHRPAFASCEYGGHEIWWFVDATGGEEALGWLPRYVAERSTAARVREVSFR